MTAFIMMREEDVLAALEGHPYILDDIAKPATEQIRKTRCPECAGVVAPMVDPKDPFDKNLPSFRYIGQCTACSCQFDPGSGVIRRPGNKSPILPAIGARLRD